MIITIESLYSAFKNMDPVVLTWFFFTCNNDFVIILDVLCCVNLGNNEINIHKSALHCHIVLFCQSSAPYVPGCCAVHATPLCTQGLLKELVANCDGQLKCELTQLAAYYEHRLQLGQKAIYHLEAFVTRFMAVYKRFLEEGMQDFF